MIERCYKGRGGEGDKSGRKVRMHEGRERRRGNNGIMIA